MSDLSHEHCRKCRQPDYACDCEEPDFIEPALAYLMRGEEIPEHHPFHLERNRRTP
jgi:hypothetical protein